MGASFALPTPAVATTGMERYAADLDSYRAQLETAIRDYKSSGYEDLSALQRSVEIGGLREVVLPDGSVVEFDVAVLADELPDRIHTDGTARQAMRVVVRLERAIALARGEPAPRPAGAEDPRELLEAELSGGAYALPADADLGDDYRSSFQEGIRAWWADLVRKLTWQPQAQPQQTQPLFPAFNGKWVIAAVAVLLAAVLAAFLLAQGGRIQVGRPLGLGAGPGSGGDLPDARQRSPLGWREHADKLAAEGFLREAVRAQFLSVLARLDRTREIDYRPERTNGEHLRTFTGAQFRMGSFRQATSMFEEAWYGAVEIDGDDYRCMSEACDLLVVRDPVGAGEEA